MNLKKEVAHQPFSCEIAGAKTAVIFIHGILEGPYQFHGLSEKILDLGVSSFGLLLPGHGGSARQFAKSHRRQWVRYVDRQIDAISKRYPQIILVGHSMGTLLSLLACRKHPSIIGVVCLATPLAVKVNLKGFICSLKVLTGRYSQEDDYVLASYRAWSISKGSWGDYLHWIPRYLDLFHLMYETKRELPSVRQPLLFIHCQQDEFVRGKTTKILKNKLRGHDYELLELCESGHFYYRNDEGTQLEEAILAFITKCQQQHNKKR